MSLYQQAFGLESEPFNMTPDPELLFVTGQHREALASLGYAILARKGFAVFTGPAGSGKTTLVRKFLRSSQAQGVQSSVILNPTLTPSEFLEMALFAFGVGSAPASKAKRICMIQGFLLECHTQGRIAALVVDEAHKLSPEVLEEIRLLGNFEFDDRKLLQIVLVGQSELRDILNRADLQQLKQRIAIQFSLKPLSAEEVGPYLQYRWLKAGGQTQHPFAPAAIQLIASASRGIPRVINAVCDNVLLEAFAAGTTAVTEAQVRDVCRDLELFAEPAPPTAETARPAGEPLLPAEALQTSAPPAVLNRESPPLRILEAYDPAQRPSWWARWMGRKVPRVLRYYDA